MRIINSLLVNNPCYKQGKKLNVKGLMLHSVGCAQPSAEVFVKNWNKETYTRACVHGFIDANTGNIYQCLPWNYRGWHGGGSSNNTHIGVEMCEPGSIKYTGSGAKFTILDNDAAIASATRTYVAAVELFAMLCKEFNLDPLEPGVIVSHKEGHALGIASNHGDPDHLWKGLGLPYTMTKFRNDVANYMGYEPDATNATPDNPVKLSEIKKAESFNKSFAGSYRTTDELNIRAGAGIDNEIVGVIPDGELCRCYGYYSTSGISKWYYISYKGVEGYCNRKYLEKV